MGRPLRIVLTVVAVLVGLVAAIKALTCFGLWT
jgi:hypothetical protein